MQKNIDALNESIAHWQEEKQKIVDMGGMEWEKLMNSPASPKMNIHNDVCLIHITSKYCPLCKLPRSGGVCPLNPKCNEEVKECIAEWEDVAVTFSQSRSRQELIDAMERMIDKLKEALND